VRACAAAPPAPALLLRKCCAPRQRAPGVAQAPGHRRGGQRQARPLPPCLQVRPTLPPQVGTRRRRQQQGPTAPTQATTSPLATVRAAAGPPSAHTAPTPPPTPPPPLIAPPPCPLR
jgi:hypothetical protein